MQIAILAVLALIACILAPWLLGVLVAGIALYGIWLVIGLIVSIIVGALCLLWFVLSPPRRSRPSRTEQMISEANLQTRAKEAVERLEHEAVLAQPKKTVKTVACASCNAEIAKYSLYCPVCGKPTKGAYGK